LTSAAITLTAFLALVYFLQSEEAAERLVALQDVVVKSASFQGIANRTGFSSFQDEEELLWDDDDFEEETDDDIAEDQDEKDQDFTEEAKDAKVDDIAAKSKPKEEKPVTSQAKEEEDDNDDASTSKAAEEDESGETNASSSKGKTDSSPKDTPTKGETPRESDNKCSSMCLSREKEQKDRWRGDLLDISEVERLAKEQYDKLIARLKNDYGEEYFTKIFEVDGKSRGRSAFLSANPEDDISLQRFKRKLKMKLLSVQLSIERERETVGECDCKVEAKVNSRSLKSNEMPPLADHHERFVWATGGHSSATGHGNLFNESYTAVMENALVDIFG
jgi:hypothetical protein